MCIVNQSINFRLLDGMQDTKTDTDAKVIIVTRDKIY